MKYVAKLTQDQTVECLKECIQMLPDDVMLEALNETLTMDQVNELVGMLPMKKHKGKHLTRTAEFCDWMGKSIGTQEFIGTGECHTDRWASWMLQAFDHAQSLADKDGHIVGYRPITEAGEMRSGWHFARPAKAVGA